VNPSRVFILRPVATALLTVGLLLTGLVAYLQLPVSALPQVDYPTIQVVSFYPGASHVVRPGGEIADRAPLLEEHLLVTEIDLRDSDRLRWRLPLLDAERSDIEGPAA